MQDKSPACEAGLRSGSVILSVNDQTVEHDDHETLVKRITQASQTQLKLVVIQQNINKQIALCEQLQQLHKQLHEKEEELEELCRQDEANSGGNIVNKGKQIINMDLFSSICSISRRRFSLPTTETCFC